MENTEIEQIKKRLARLEEEVFGMTYEEAEAVVDSYVDAVAENPGLGASPSLLKAEKILGV